MQSIPKIGSIAALVTLAAAGGPAYADLFMDMTPGVTEISQEVHGLHRLMFYWCVGIGVLVFGAMFYSIFKHRKSVGAEAATFHESTTVEIIWTIIPFFILILMAIPATKLLIKMDDTSESALTVKVTGSQWKWQYDYLDYEGNNEINYGFLSVLTTPKEQIYTPLFNSGLHPKNMAAFEGERPAEPERGEFYNLEVDNHLVIPTGQKVRFLITSDDVIHAWWVPDFGIKKDAIPGFINELWTIVPEGKEGLYRGQCAELGGKDHAFMPIVVEAKSQADFKQWLADEAEKANNIVNQTFTMEEMMAVGEKEYLSKCASCHQANGAGLPPTFPALAGSPIAVGDLAEHIRIVKEGKGAMPAFSGLDLKSMAAIITYERNAWGNDTGDLIQARDVADQ